MTPAQQRALDELLPRYGLDTGSGPLDLDTAFGHRAPRFLEIGFGMGTSLLQLAKAHPERDYIGIEVHRPGVGGLLLQLRDEDLPNVRVACADAVEVLDTAIPEHSLDGIYLLFPDPWHKRKHHKRRILQPDFVARAGRRLKPGGRFHLATDWRDYAEHMLAIMDDALGFTNTAGAGRFAPRGERPVTKYEQRGRQLGHGVWDLVFEYRGNADR